MKNYTYGWRLQQLGYVEIPKEQYTDRQRDMAAYIELLSEAVRQGDCGWDGVRYAVMQYTDGSIEKYMVIYCNEGGSRWIPINGNNKGCNLSVLGENLW